MVLNTKKIIAATATAGLVLSLVGSNAYAAADASASVTDDGNAYSSTYDNDEFSISNTNHGSLDTFDLGTGNSGFNKQGWNDDENEMTTGTADGFAGSENFLNSTVGSIEDVDTETSVAEATVGEDGYAKAKAYDNDDISVWLKNYGRVENKTIGIANSGFNYQSKNDDANSMETGDTEAMATALTEVNSTWLMLGGGDHGAQALAEVGNDGNAWAKAYDNDELNLSIWNRAGVDTLSLALANSGGNSQSRNDDDNTMTTGGATASSHQETYVNSVVVNTGNGNGGAVASATVGEDGDSYSTASDNDQTNVSVSNSAEVNSASVAVGNSGGNSQAGNDDNNSVTTGNASGQTCSTQTVNSFWFGNVPAGEGSHGCN